MLEYLGKGLGFPIKTNVQGGLQISVAERSVEESIQIILRTSPGERVYRPDFGSRLGELVFAPLNLQTLLLIQLSVREALEQWEPRILLEEVETDPDPVKGRVEITIIYRLISQPDLRSLVYPFYLLPASADSQA
jgi:uncharacterized protein